MKLSVEATQSFLHIPLSHSLEAAASFVVILQYKLTDDFEIYVGVKASWPDSEELYNFNELIFTSSLKRPGNRDSNYLTTAIVFAWVHSS